MLNSYLMIAVLGPLGTARLSPSSSPLMNEKQVEREGEGEGERARVKTSPRLLSKCLPRRGLFRKCTIDTNPTSHSRTSQSMMYGPLHFLVRWPTTLNTHLQHTTKLPPNGTAPNIHTHSHTLCQVCVSREKWALCCLRPLQLKASSLD